MGRGLHTQFKGLIGRKCWIFAFTDGGMLSLHFGRRHSYPSVAGKRTGAWQVDTRAAAWSAITPHIIVSSRERGPECEKDLEAKLKWLDGPHVTN